RSCGAYGLEVETGAQLEETRIEDPGWILPARTVEGEDAVRGGGVQGIGEVKVHRRPRAAKAENLGHPEVELVDVLRILFANQVHVDGSESARQRQVPIGSLAGRHRVVGLHFRTLSRLERGGELHINLRHQIRAEELVLGQEVRVRVTVLPRDGNATGR